MIYKIFMSAKLNKTVNLIKMINKKWKLVLKLQIVMYYL